MTVTRADPASGGASLLLAGLERPTAGTLRVDGVDLGTPDAIGLADLRRDRICTVFRSFHLSPILTTLDSVAGRRLPGAG